jgi:DNA polymerase-3 subunit alpha
MKGVSLHHHSTFSYMDGFGTPEDHVARAADLGMSALALTEHGNVSSHVRLENAATSHGIKPIFGLEAYTAASTMREDKNTRKWHLTLLAMNDEGYRNLMRLVTRSWLPGEMGGGFYMWPTIHGEDLAEFNEGLIVLSGCADSKLACDLLGGKGREKGSERDARRTMERFKDILGDRFYLECQQFPELDRTHAINTWYEGESRRTGVPLVGTADVHYPHPDDNHMQKILHTAGRGGVSVAVTEASWEYDIRLTHPTSDKGWLQRLQGTGLSRRGAAQALMSTTEIAERCNVVLPKADNLRFPKPDGTSTKELIWEWLREGWRYRAKSNMRLRMNTAEYHERLVYEMNLIEAKGFFDYFLMLSDAVRWCKDRGIAVGPARGSAAASLTCYLLRITEIDPVPIPTMLFERFIDLNRDDLPDIDLDFDDERRHELVTHMTDLYGADRVGNVGTFTKYKGKNSLDDVARAFQIPKWEVQPVKDLVVERSGGDSRADASLEDTVDMFPAAKAVFDKHPALEASFRLEGNYRGFSVHASGLVVSNDPLTDNVAYYSKLDKKSGNMRQVLSVDKYDAEYLGLMKVDLLGLSNMGMIGRALDLIGMKLDDLYVVANPTLYEDPEVIDAFRQNDVKGIFQFGGESTKIVNGDVKPDNFMELCDINALSRPGPLHSGTTADYINIKHGRMEPIHMHPVVDEITKHTHNCIIYQEQILRIIREVGDFDWHHAAAIRTIISKKHGEQAFNRREEAFHEGSKRLHNMDRETSVLIWRRLATAGTYAFNAAHCVSYSMLAYWTMWLKVKHPAAFYAASLTKAVGDKDKRYDLLRDAVSRGIEFLPPHPNRSEDTWTITKSGKIMGGLRQVPGIGPKMTYTVLEDRATNGNYKSWSDLQRIKGIGPKTVEKMEAFAKSDDPYGIYRIARILDRVREAIDAGDLGLIPSPTHKGSEIPTDAKRLRVVFVGIPDYRNPQDVVEDERARTGEDYNTILARMDRPDLAKKMAVHCVDDSDTSVYLRFSRYKFPKFAKGLWSIDLNHDVVIVSGLKRGGFGTSVHVDRMWIIDPCVLFNEDEVEALGLSHKAEADEEEAS